MMHSKAGRKAGKLLSFIAAIALVIGTIPFNNAVFAAGEHVCTACEGEYEWTPFTQNTTLEAEKHYYLEKDLTLSQDIVADFGDSSAFLCLNGYNIEFTDGAYVDFVGDSAVQVFNCGNTGGGITTDLEYTVDLSKDIRGLSTNEYNNVFKPAEMALYPSYGDETHAKLTDKRDPGVWKVYFEDVSLIGGDESVIAHVLDVDNEFSLGFKNHVTDDKSVLAGSSEYINVTQNYDTDTSFDYIMGANGCADCAINVDLTAEDENVNLDQNFTAYLLADGEKIKEVTFNALLDGGPYFVYLDGYFAPDPEYDGVISDFGTICIPAYYDGVKGDYSVELVHDQYALKLASTSTDGDGTGYPAYTYNYNYIVSIANKVDSISVNMSELRGGSAFPTNATSNVPAEYEVKSIEWTHYGLDIDAASEVVEGEVYTAYITVEPKNDYVISYNATATVNGEDAGGVHKHNDGTVTIEYNVLASEAAPEINYTGFTPLADVDLAFEATQTDIQSNLPATVTIQTTEGTQNASVNWTTIPTIDTSDLDGQTITASGTITLPDGVTNPNSVSTNITCKFNVAAAPQVEEPTADVESNTYTEDKTVKLSAADGATIYYTLDGTEPTAQNGTQYNEPIEIKGTEGSRVEKTFKAIAVKNEMRDSDVATYDYIIEIPNEAPDITITVKESSWKNFLNDITFGLFFKNTQIVAIEAEDEASEVAKIEYFVSETVYTEEQLKNDSTIDWKPYNSSFSLDPSGKYIVYAKATDTAAAENVGYAYSNGFVLYSDSEAETNNLIYIKTVTQTDPVAEVKLNDNTVKEIKVENTVIEDSNYTVSDDGKITFKKAYLETLAADTYTVTVSYNPLGEEYKEDAGNDEPSNTTFELKIVDTPEKNEEDGTYKDTDGNVYVDVDTDGDGEINEKYVPVEKNDVDGYFYGNVDSDDDDEKLIPVDMDGNGDFDHYIPDGVLVDDTDGDDTNDDINKDGIYTPEGETEPEYVGIDEDGDGDIDYYLPKDVLEENEEKYDPIDKDDDGDIDHYVPDNKFDEDKYAPIDDDNDEDIDRYVPKDDLKEEKYVAVDDDNDGETDRYVPEDKINEGIKAEDGHVHQEKVPASCDQGAYCGSCGNYYGVALGHAWSDWESCGGTHHQRKCKRDGCRSGQTKEHSTKLSCGDTSIKCEDCGATGAGQHVYGKLWKANSSQHWYECQFCPERKDEDSHKYKEESSGDAPQTCTECQYGTRVTPVSLGDDYIVPQTLMKNGIRSVDDIKDKMLETVQGEDSDGFGAVLYDALLEYSMDGVNWYLASVDHFPADGKLLVTLNVPKGTKIDTHRYEVLHMYTTGDFGKAPGHVEHIETPDIFEGVNEAGEHYISFYVTGLSPIMIASWEEAAPLNTARSTGDIPIDEDGNIPIDDNGDGEIDDYITEDELDKNKDKYVPIDKDDDGKVDYYVPKDAFDKDKYIPIDKDGDGDIDHYVPKESFDDSKYHHIDKDDDGEVDYYIPNGVLTDPDGDGIYTPDSKKGPKYEGVDLDGDGVIDMYVLLTEDDGVDSGDDSNMLPWLLVMMTAMTAAAVIVLGSRYRRN